MPSAVCPGMCSERLTVAAVGQIESDFAAMDLIDKTAFPFPYAQVMKIMLYVYAIILPFVLEMDSGPALVRFHHSFSVGTPLILV